jgi:hypothetical protein
MQIIYLNKVFSRKTLGAKAGVDYAPMQLIEDRLRY